MLKDKIAVVTGGSSGIGFATAKEFAEQGATVVIASRDARKLNEKAKEINAIAIPSDQGSLKDIDNLVREVKARFGMIDILFINAGIVSFSSIEDATEQHYDSMMNINLKGSFFTLSKFIPIIKKGGCVTLLSSINATTGQSNSSVYSAGKAALNSIVKVGSTELAAKGIRINAVSPGPIETNLLAATGLDAPSIDTFAQKTLSKIPVKRFGKAWEVAKLVAFLSSDDAGYITGSDFVVDGGTQVNPIIG